LVWGWLEIYFGLICGLLRVGSRFSVRLFGVVSGCISKIVGALLRVSLSCYFRLANVFLGLGSTFIYG